tara:strand:+ start:3360 stop:3962 length:603 start_codon:yes stop_codon:yes gene_type:complete
MKAIDLLIKRVHEIGHSRNWKVDETSNLLDIKPHDTEIAAKIISIDQYTLVIGELASRIDNVIEDWSKLQGFAAQVRTRLTPSRNEDVLLFLVGPEINEDDFPEWKSRATQIERNDLVCRKLVWLPTKQENTVEISLTSFIERTFLSRPWSNTTSAKQPELDKLSSTSIIPTSWKKILEENSINPDCNVIVEQLIQSLES